MVLAGFQNCGKAHFSDSASTQSSSANSAAGDGSTLGGGSVTGGGPAGPVEGNGNVLTNKLGQQISFVNILGRSIGTVKVLDASSDITVQLLNDASGRKATVKVVVDPKTGRFVSVKLVTPLPYMCHDPLVNACLNFSNISSVVDTNCSSPIFFTGSLTGSVNHLTETADVTFCANPAAGLCMFSLSSQGWGATAGMTQASCRAHCRTNQDLNPTDRLTCTFSGQPISF